MKSQIIKSIIPVLIFVLGIAGAFGTMSMQKVTEEATVTGWVHDVMGNPCSLAIECTDTGTQFCEYGVEGEIAKLKSGTLCLTQLRRP